jgi:hypothetical protein
MPAGMLSRIYPGLTTPNVSRAPRTARPSLSTTGIRGPSFPEVDDLFHEPIEIRIDRLDLRRIADEIQWHLPALLLPDLVRFRDFLRRAPLLAGLSEIRPVAS